MRKRGTARSLAQQWVAERCFSDFGSLGGAITRLGNIAKHKGTLPIESAIINEAIRNLLVVEKAWDNDLNKEQSRDKFIKESQ